MENNKKMKKGKIAALVGVIVTLGVVVGVYVGFGVYFESHFFYGTTINGMSASGLTVTDMEKVVSDAADGYELEIVQNGKVVDKVEASQIGLIADPESGEIESFLDSQDAFAWPARIFNPENYIAQNLVTFDEDGLLRRAKTFSCVKKSPTVETKDAYCHLEGGQFVIAKEVQGNKVDAKDISSKLKPYIMGLKGSVDLAKDGLYKAPEITSQSPELLESLEILNSTIGMKISYEVGEVIDSELIAEWITLDSGNNIIYDEEKIYSFVKSMSNKYNTAGLPKTLKTSYGNEVTVQGGNYGWMIDREKEAATILENLKGGVDVQRDFEYTITAASHGEKDYGDSYVEVNLTTQHLFLYVDGKMVLDTPFVSGNISRGWGTHVGAYRVTYKQKNATLRGEGYATPVDFWMPFHNGEGLHDATWRATFGGNIYKTNGSHGCVNLPHSMAKAIFSYVDTGFPVLVYADASYSPGSATVIPAEVTSQSVINQITSIGPVTLESETAIANARRAYNSLSDEEKAKVTNIDVLAASEQALTVLKSATTPENTQSGDNANPTDQQNPVTPPADDTTPVNPDNNATPNVPDYADTQTDNNQGLPTDSNNVQGVVTEADTTDTEGATGNE